MCKHGKLLMYCSECYAKFQVESDKRWWDNQQKNAEAVKRFNQVTYPLYVATCGNPQDTIK